MLGSATGTYASTSYATGVVGTSSGTGAIDGVGPITGPATGFVGSGLGSSYQTYKYVVGAPSTTTDAYI
jgi:hypothetical protein